MNSLRFNKRFSKLEEKEFETIRLTTRFKEKDLCNIVVKGQCICSAMLVQIRDAYIKDLSDDFLKNDTDTTSRRAAISLLRQFYPQLTEFTEVSILKLRRESEIFA